MPKHLLYCLYVFVTKQFDDVFSEGIPFSIEEISLVFLMGGGGGGGGGGGRL